MKDPIERQDAIDAIKAIPDGNWSSKRYVTAIKELPPAQPEQRPLTEDDYAYCAECDHVEMCRWYPMYGCEFKSRPSAHPEIIRCKDCKHKPSGSGANHDISFPDEVCPCRCEDYWYSWMPKDNWFCGSWERRED